MRGRTLKLDARDWSGYIARIAADREHSLAEVGVLTSKPSTQPQRRRLHTIAYDRRANELELVVREDGHHHPALRYFVSAPRAITVEECDHTTAIIVDDASGIRTLIRLCAAPVGARSRDLVDTMWAPRRIRAPQAPCHGGRRRWRLVAKHRGEPGP